MKGKEKKRTTSSYQTIQKKDIIMTNGKLLDLP